MNLRQFSDARINRNGGIVEKTAAAALRPDPRMRVSEHAARYRMVSADASVLPGPWSNDVAPELVEIMDRCSPDDPCGEVKVKKCAQSGGSEVGCNLLCFVMHKSPGPTMYVGPTVAAAKDWKVEKLDPTITATDVLNPDKGGAVLPQKSRSGEGSTSNRLRFKGGFILFAGANSAATLRQHSIRFMVRDDRSAWTKDAEGKGDPKDLSDTRLKTYRRYGMSKCLDISSPVGKGEDIDLEYENSDRRRYYIACKNDACGTIHDLVWEDIKREKAPPYRCRWYCPVCQTEHSDGDKAVMKAPSRGAIWIPTLEDADGVVPPKSMRCEEAAAWRAKHESRYIHGYALTGELTGFETWDELARQEDAAGDDPEKRKVFENEGLGRGYEQKGEGPAWEVLAARKELWLRGTAPAPALYFTFSVDVQDDGIYWSRIGWAPNKENWLVGCGYVSGPTAVPFEGAWPKLDIVVDHGFRLASGAKLADDLILVDSGHNVTAVYQWVRRRHNAIAVKGEDGWSREAIFGARASEVKKSGPSAGKAARYGLKVWLVGTWGLKSALMVYLGREAKEGKAGFPTGYCHFPGDTPNEYFRHMSSEYLKVEQTGAGPVREWKRKGPNHWLDCRIYAMAGAHHAGLWAWSETKWAQRAAELAALARPATPDLFDHAASTGAAVAPVEVEDVIDTDLPPLVPAEPLAVLRQKPKTIRMPVTVADNPYL
jgi:phage terminase large subunit GpA-like protein